MNTPVPELTIEEMMARIRAQLAARQAGHVLDAAHPFDGDPCLSHSRTDPDHTPERYRGFKPHIDWHQFVCGLRTAEQYAAVANYLPELPRLPALLRQAAQLVARGILQVIRFVVNRQNAYNHAALGVILNVHGVLRHLEKVQTENVRRLEEVLARHRGAVEELRGQVGRLEEELARTRFLLEAQQPSRVEVEMASAAPTSYTVTEWQA